MRIAFLLIVFASANLAADRTAANFAAKSAAAFTENYRTGVRLMKERDWQRADAAFAQALSYRDSPDARRMSRACRFNLYQERGAAFLANHSYDSAAEQYQRALDLNSRDTAAIDGLRTAQYQAAFRDGMASLSGRSEDRARRFFERCLEIRPQDAAARLQLQSLDAAARTANERRASWAQVEGCLKAQDARCLDLAVPRLSAAAHGLPDETLQQEFDATLLPALTRYGAGDLDGAEAAARKASGAAATQLRSILRSKLRWQFARNWAGWSIGLYAITLLAGLYFGVKDIRTRQLGRPHLPA